MFKHSISLLLLLAVIGTATAQYKSRIGSLYGDLNCKTEVDTVYVDDSGILPSKPGVNPVAVKMDNNQAAYIWTRKENGPGNACRDQHELAPALQCHHFANKAVIRCLSKTLL